MISKKGNVYISSKNREYVEWPLGDCRLDNYIMYICTLLEYYEECRQYNFDTLMDVSVFFWERLEEL